MTMQKIEPYAPEAQSADLVADNISKLKALFPELVSETVHEGKTTATLNVDVLKALVGDQTVTDADEKYGLNWHGKRKARQMALTPSTGTLRPCPEESVDWETTQNLMIEGDNLEVLKLLQKSYAGKVKLIYIDPPYNTGKDFVYPDNFQDNIRNYLEITGQTEGGVRISSNTDASGRFHTDWLNMMYPRLKLARNLLRDDGVIFISIHYRELSNALRLCDEIFGEENFVGNITWKARVKPVNIGDAKYRPQGETEYVLIYQRSDVEGKFQPLYTGGIRTYPYEIDGRKYRLTTILKSNRGGNYRSTMSFEIDGYSPPEGQRWQAGEAEIRRLNQEGYIEFKDGVPSKRYYEDEEGAEHDPFYCFMDSEWSSTSEAGKSELNSLLGNDHGFDTVKPTRLIRTLIQSITKIRESDIVLDFFAGSGSTGDALFAQNSSDSGNRRFILVQLPEILDINDKDQKTMAEFCLRLGLPLRISEVTKARLRQAGVNLGKTNPDYGGDIGFRVFKLDTSNIRAWNPNPTDVKASLFAHLDHIEPGRSNDDVLYEVLLKLGLDLCVPMEHKNIAGKTVHSVGGGALLACLDAHIGVSDAEALALGMAEWREQQGTATETTAIFRDSAFENDVAKSNVAAILEQHGIKQVRSL